MHNTQGAQVVGIKRRQYDKKYCVVAKLDASLITENIEEFYEIYPLSDGYTPKQWFTVGVFDHFIPAKKCAKYWRRKISPDPMAVKANGESRSQVKL